MRRRTSPSSPWPTPATWWLVLFSVVSLSWTAAALATPVRELPRLLSSSKYQSLRSLETQESSACVPETRIRGSEFRGEAAHQENRRLKLELIGLFEFAYGRKASDALELSRDPIGFRWGLNLYAYTSNNPISRRDPLGLYFEIQGSHAEIDTLRLAMEEATGTTLVHEDTLGVIDEGQPGEQFIRRFNIDKIVDPRFSGPQRDLQSIINSKITLRARFARKGGESNKAGDCGGGWFDHRLEEAVIHADPSEWSKYYVMGRDLQLKYRRSQGVYAESDFSLAAIVTHEILGHGYQHVSDPASIFNQSTEDRESFAIRKENLVHLLLGEPIRADDIDENRVWPVIQPVMK